MSEHKREFKLKSKREMKRDNVGPIPYHNEYRNDEVSIFPRLHSTFFNTTNDSSSDSEDYIAELTFTENERNEEISLSPNPGTKEQ